MAEAPGRRVALPVSAARVAAVLAALVAGMWAGVLLCIGAIAAPAAFATLAPADAGRFVGRVFEQEAHGSIVVALLLFAIERQRSGRAAAAGVGSVFSSNLLLLLGCIFCTVAGYFGVQPLMAAARTGQGALSFGALHAVSGGFFVLKGLLALVLAWRLIRTAATTS